MITRFCVAIALLLAIALFEAGCESVDVTAEASSAPPPPPPPPPPPVQHVAEVVPYYWKAHRAEPAAPFYFYLLFGATSPRSVQLAALRAVICNLHQSAVDLPASIAEDEAPLLLPVISHFNARVGVHATEAALNRFADASYDWDRAQHIIARLGLSSANVYLLASRKRVQELPARGAVAPSADYRFVYVDRSDPYEGIAMRSVLEEAYDGTLFDGAHPRDYGYAIVSFVYRLGSVYETAVGRLSASPPPAAKQDQGVCNAD